MTETTTQITTPSNIWKTTEATTQITASKTYCTTMLQRKSLLNLACTHEWSKV